MHLSMCAWILASLAAKVSSCIVLIRRSLNGLHGLKGKVSCADLLGQLVTVFLRMIHRAWFLVDNTAGTGSVVVGCGHVFGFAGVDEML